MMKLRKLLVGLMAVAAGLLVVCRGAYAESLTYTLDISTVGDLTVAGTITTDGNMGPLTVDDIVSFDFAETSTSIPYTALFTPSTVDIDGSEMFGVGADSTGLYIDPSAMAGAM